MLSMRLRSLPLSLRPREKILYSGVESATTEELIAAVLITGIKNTTVSSFAKKIASAAKMRKVSKKLLLSLKLTPAKTAQILAAIELGKRLSQKKIVTLTKPQQIFSVSQEIIHKEKEFLLCFYVNARGELIKKEVLAVGSLNTVNIHPYEIFSFIKQSPVFGIILVHNHPSGCLEPSKQDILFTKRIKEAATILGITLLDHIIISNNGWNQIKI